MPFIIDDIAIAATEMSEVAAETAEIAGEVTESSEIIGDGIGESSLVNEKVIDAGESLNPTVSEPTEIIGDGVGETALESPESGIEQSKQVVNDNSKILGDGVVEGEETSMIENNIAIENSSTPPDIDDARLDKREQVVQNKLDGCQREEAVEKELEAKYPSPPNEIIREAYLRDEHGNIIKDPDTNTARRIDFVVVRDGEVVKSVEVTSNTAAKDAQTSKEMRIRENGGNYIKREDGTLARFPDNLSTEIERRK